MKRPPPRTQPRTPENPPPPTPGRAVAEPPQPSAAAPMLPCWNGRTGIHGAGVLPAAPASGRVRSESSDRVSEFMRADAMSGIMWHAQRIPRSSRSIARPHSAGGQGESGFKVLVQPPTASLANGIAHWPLALLNHWPGWQPVIWSFAPDWNQTRGPAVCGPARHFRSAAPVESSLPIGQCPALQAQGRLSQGYASRPTQNSKSEQRQAPRLRVHAPPHPSAHTNT